MKILTLIRHAKSDWRKPDWIDFERPLNKRGKKAAPEMGRRMARWDEQPELFISSPAQRAWQTTLALSTALEAVPVVLEQEPRLYEATLETLMDLVPSLPDFRHIALVGHNPGLQELGLWLCDDAPLTFPTAAVLMLSLNVASWSDVAPGCATILRYDYPKNHPRR